VQRTAGSAPPKQRFSGFEFFRFMGIISSRPRPPLTQAVRRLGTKYQKGKQIMSYEKKIQELHKNSEVLSNQGDFGGAIKVLSELIQFFPYPPAYTKRAMCYIDIIRSNESYTTKEIRPLLIKAKDDFSEAIKLYEVMSKGTYKQFNGDNSVSICFFERGRINMLLGTVYKENNMNVDGVDWSDRSKLADFMSKILKNDSQLLQQAVNDTNEAISHNTGNVEAYRLKGNIYETYYDDPTIAIEQYSKVISINASSMDYLKRAWCHYQLDNLNQASSDYQRATNLGLYEYDTETIQMQASRSGKGEVWMAFLNDMS
jgi:tetratricopeptide (TPR) repeat protein